mmetsp:Transcript_11547/g.24283  ORF Transcript_11547/g.24283 Transcript_11547/m.24283 type:complete len:249 (+) Transcript_11547:55-801(+)
MATAGETYQAEAEPLVPPMRLSKDVPAEVRVGFVRKVYSILTVQLLLTTAIAAPLQRASTQWVNNNQWLLFLSLALMIASMCSMCFCGGMLRMYPYNYIFLFGFTSFMGVSVGFAAAAYTGWSVILAAGVTCLIFFALTIYAWNTSTDFTGLAPYLFALLACLSIMGLVITILTLSGVQVVWLNMLYDVIAVLIFSSYIIFDTQMMLGDWGGHKMQFSIDDYVFAALTLYLDIINLFLHILSLLGERK